MHLLQRIVLVRFIEAADGNRARLCLTRLNPEGCMQQAVMWFAVFFLANPDFVDLVIHNRWVWIFESLEKSWDYDRALYLLAH